MSTISNFIKKIRYVSVNGCKVSFSKILLCCYQSTKYINIWSPNIHSIFQGAILWRLEALLNLAQNFHGNQMTKAFSFRKNNLQISSRNRVSWKWKMSIKNPVETVKLHLLQIWIIQMPKGGVPVTWSFFLCPHNPDMFCCISFLLLLQYFLDFRNSFCL